MNPLPDTSSLTQLAPAFVQGLVLSLGLIVAIGAQNAFVLRQGLRREHVMPVVLVCALSDAVLLQVGVYSMCCTTQQQNFGLIHVEPLARGSSKRVHLLKESWHSCRGRQVDLRDTD